MGQALTDRETVAGVLAMLVRERCATASGRKTSRTGLQSSIPVSERPSVRRGLDALVERGILAMNGEDIGFTSKGKVFLAYVQRAKDMAPTNYEQDESDPAVLAQLLTLIEDDPRFEPARPLDEVRMLPARIDGFRKARNSRLGKKWLVLGGLAAAVAAFTVLR